MDEVSVWNRALSGQELRALMHHPLSGAEAGLLGYWKLDEGADATARDSGAHGHDGALLNDPTWIDSSAPIVP